MPKEVFYERYGKRYFDLLISIFKICLIWPLLVLTASLTYFNLGNPIIFRQTRAGKGGIPFEIIKFRTMRHPSQSNKGEDKDRLTNLGIFLRRFSLDELPSLLNIFKGDMSLVGPRPLLIDYVKEFDLNQLRRLEIRPGLTGWAQINGRNLLDWEKKFELDLWYVEKLSMFLDFKILLLTIIKIFQNNDVSYPEHSTMPYFKRKS